MPHPVRLVFLATCFYLLLCRVRSCPPSRPPPCSWTTCRHEWRNDWNPTHVPQGHCINQYRYAAHIHTRHHGSGSCPGPQGCSNARQGRQMCQCRNAHYCPLHQWGYWSGVVNQGTCGRQSRFRDYNEHIRYLTQSSCSGIKSSCGSRQYDYRAWCSCRYAQCTLGGWSSWTDMSSPVSHDHCASQQRRRTYTLTWKYIERRDDCNGVMPQSCPVDLQETREKVITCPRLPAVAHGGWDRDDCSNSNQICKSACSLTCDTRNGYQVEGPLARTCKATGQWTTPWDSYCKDVQPPSIRCPNSIITNTDPGKSTARITIPMPVATDNSGEAPKITHDAGQASQDFTVSATPHTVKFTATDKAGLSSSCVLHITVKDEERPKVTFCPKDIKIETNQNSKRVTWTYPTFVDNNDKSPDHPLRITSNRNPGSSFPWGRYRVIYNAFDRANNNATCEFYVEVGPVKCPIFEPPQFGIRACNKKTQDANGVTFEMFCSVQCKSGYAFAELAPQVFMCRSDGVWHHMMYGFPAPISDQMKKPWADCAPKTEANSAAKEFTFYTGACAGNDDAALNQIRHNFLEAIKNSHLANYALCEVSQGLDCVVENVKVYCGERSKRNNDPPQRIISFDFVINDLKPDSDRAKEVIKLQKMMKELDVLEGYLKTQFPVSANMPNLRIQALGSSVFCPKKTALVIPKGAGSDLQRAICVECPVGTFYNEKSRNCSICPLGTYQDEMGQTVCKSCPSGTLTVVSGAINETLCYDTCEAGEYRHIGEGGAATCLACPIGTYQPQAFSKSCLKCPDGKSTTRVGAMSVNECK